MTYEVLSGMLDATKSILSYQPPVTGQIVECCRGVHSESAAIAAAAAANNSSVTE